MGPGALQKLTPSTGSVIRIMPRFPQCRDRAAKVLLFAFSPSGNCSRVVPPRCGEVGVGVVDVASGPTIGCYLQVSVPPQGFPRLTCVVAFQISRSIVEWR